MKKGLTKIMALLSLSGLASCANGIEKEYTMSVKESCIAYVTSEVQEETHDIYLIHCKKSLSPLNYYIEVSELPDKLPEKLIAKNTGKKINYHIEINGKDAKVSNHGYEFVKWLNN